MEELEDMTTCGICCEVFTDPKALPCMHTFCMACIQETGFQTKKRSGDFMPCPFCRRPFKIPNEGFSGLRKNFCVERVIEALKDLDPLAKALKFCCLDDSKTEEDTEILSANACCVDGKNELREQHRQFKLTKNQKFIPILKFESGKDVVCEVEEQIRTHCTECKTSAFAIDANYERKGSHVDKCVDDLPRQIQDNADAISQLQSKKKELSRVQSEMQKRMKSIVCEIVARKEQIRHSADEHANRLLHDLCSERKSRSDEIKKATDDIHAHISYLERHNSDYQGNMAKGSVSHISRVLPKLPTEEAKLQQHCNKIIEKEVQDFKLIFRQSELEALLKEDGDNIIGEIYDECNIKRKKSRQILLAEQSQEIDILRKKNEQLRKERTYSNALISRLNRELDKTKTDINALQVSVDKLKQENAEKVVNNSLEAINYKTDDEFESDMQKATRKNFDINAEKLENEQTLKAVLVATIRTKAAEEKNREIRGFTILDKELFVVSQQNSEVEVYDSVIFNFSRRWTLKDLNDPLDIGSCNRNKYLYIFNSKGRGKSKEILRVETDGNVTRKWSTGNVYGWGLSITKESNVIVTAFNRDKLDEFSPDGQLIREISISSDAGIHFPWHAIKLASGNFVISHGVMHRVSIVDGEGQLMKSFGGKSGSTIGQRNGPTPLAVDRLGSVMVVDQSNSRVLLLNSDLEYQGEILSKDEHRLRRPSRILLDESSRRLLVADNDSNNPRILVFEIIR